MGELDCVCVACWHASIMYCLRSFHELLISMARANIPIAIDWLWTHSGVLSLHSRWILASQPWLCADANNAYCRDGMHTTLYLYTPEHSGSIESQTRSTIRSKISIKKIILNTGEHAGGIDIMTDVNTSVITLKVFHLNAWRNTAIGLHNHHNSTLEGEFFLMTK